MLSPSLVVCKERRVLYLLQQISMWRSSNPNDKRSEDVILHDDFDPCPPISVQRRRRHGDLRLKRAGYPVYATTNQLWPYSHISATVATLNSANVGFPSEAIEFVTPEGRKCLKRMLLTMTIHQQSFFGLMRSTQWACLKPRCDFAKS